MEDKKALLILTSSNTALSTKTQFCCLLLFADNVYKVYIITALCASCNVVQPAEDISLSTLYHCTVPLHDLTGYLHGYFLVVKNPKTKVCKRNL